MIYHNSAERISWAFNGRRQVDCTLGDLGRLPGGNNKDRLAYYQLDSGGGTGPVLRQDSEDAAKKAAGLQAAWTTPGVEGAPLDSGLVRPHLSNGTSCGATFWGVWSAQTGGRSLGTVQGSLRDWLSQHTSLSTFQKSEGVRSTSRWAPELQGTGCRVGGQNGSPDLGMSSKNVKPLGGCKFFHLKMRPALPHQDWKLTNSTMEYSRGQISTFMRGNRKIPHDSEM